MWMEEAKVEIQNFSNRHINALIQGPQADFTWKFTGFYGHPEASKRHEAWALLRYLGHLDPLPWMCIGGFNEVVNGTEKWGGRTRHRRGMQEFQRALEDCGLSDLGFCGSKYTWSHCQDGINFIKERLDRGVANLEWRHYYPEAVVNVDAAVSSDHAPLILSLLNNGSKVARKSFFRFEAGWALNDGYKYEVSTIWNLPWPGKMGWECLSNKLSACMLKITHWNEGFSKPSQNRLACMRARLAELQGMERMGNSESMVRLKRDIETLTEQEDLWWRQRAKLNWLKHGNRNTKYFHACASSRRKKKTILERSRMREGSGGRLWRG